MVIKHKFVYDAMMLLRAQKGADEARRQTKKLGTIYLITLSNQEDNQKDPQLKSAGLYSLNQ